MKILFLGTSAGWPLPRLGCRCPICNSRDPKDRRTRPSILINNQILIDAGPDLYWQLQREKVNTTKITHCFITHRHKDHTAGLFDLEKIYNRQQKLKIIRGQGKHEEYQINNLKIIFFKVVHSRTTPTCGIRVEEKGKSLAYIPDMKKIPPESLRFVRDANLLIVGGSSLGSVGEAGGHLPIEKNIPLIKKILKPKLTYFTHLGHKTLPHKQFEAYIQKIGGKNFHIALDGLELTL